MKIFWQFLAQQLFWATFCKSWAKFFQSSGVNLLKLFGINLLTLFCKLDILIAMQQILFMFVKWTSLQKL
jgi:hypothetical protein